MEEPIRQTATWIRGGTPEDALGAIEAYARSHKARVERGGHQLTLDFGSRLVFRLMGLVTSRLPYAVRVSVEPDQDRKTRLIADAYGDTGPYPHRIDDATLAFQTRLSETLSELQRV